MTKPNARCRKKPLTAAVGALLYPFLRMQSLFLGFQRYLRITWLRNVTIRYRRKVAKRERKRLNSLVFRASLLSQQGDQEGALALLRPDIDHLPAGTIDLFKSFGVESDADWLKHINNWASARNIGEISLAEGSQSRFNRIAFQKGKSALAPNLVTIIMPCFNCADTLEVAVASILKQTWSNIEVIAVNDASTDTTLELLERLAKKDKRLRVLDNNVNVGPYVSRNRALMEACGDYITCHDADDIALPDRIEKQMAPILSDRNCKGTLHQMVRFDQQGHASFLSKVNLFSFDGICRIASVSLLLERRVINEHLGFWDSVAFGADSEFINRATIVLGDQIKVLDDILMFCLTSEKSLTGNAKFGISAEHGVSPIRKEYKESWTRWHDTSRVESLYLNFPEEQRAYPAPAEMVVPIERIDSLTTKDAKAHPGA